MFTLIGFFLLYFSSFFYKYNRHARLQLERVRRHVVTVFRFPAKTIRTNSTSGDVRTSTVRCKRHDDDGLVNARPNQ